jgi:hypothetical protein
LPDLNSRISAMTGAPQCAIPQRRGATGASAPKDQRRKITTLPDRDKADQRLRLEPPS